MASPHHAPPRERGLCLALEFGEQPASYATVMSAWQDDPSFAGLLLSAAFGSYFAALTTGQTRVKNVDSSRGVYRFKFKNPEYRQAVLEAWQNRIPTAPADSLPHHPPHEPSRE